MFLLCDALPDDGLYDTLRPTAHPHRTNRPAGSDSDDHRTEREGGKKERKRPALEAYQTTKRKDRLDTQTAGQARTPARAKGNAQCSSGMESHLQLYVLYLKTVQISLNPGLWHRSPREAFSLVEDSSEYMAIVAGWIRGRWWSRWSFGCEFSGPCGESRW